MANRERGEVVLPAGERQIKLALTLGALAEIEDVFQVESIDALGDKLNKPKVKDLLELIRCLSLGGGQEVSVDELKKLPIDLYDAKDAIMTVLQRANPDAEKPSTEPGSEPPSGE